MESFEHRADKKDHIPNPDAFGEFRPEIADELLKEEIDGMGGTKVDLEKRLDIEQRRLRAVNKRIEEVLAQFQDYGENVLPKIIEYEPHRAFRESQAVVRTLHDRVQWSMRSLENFEQGKGKYIV